MVSHADDEFWAVCARVHPWLDGGAWRRRSGAGFETRCENTELRSWILQCRRGHDNSQNMDFRRPEPHRSHFPARFNDLQNSIFQCEEGGFCRWGGSSCRCADLAGPRAGRPSTSELMQMDVAAAAPDTKPGWIFRTLAYDASASDTSPWLRMRSVGPACGNDEGVTPQGVQAETQTIKETIVSGDAPSGAVSHLCWAGRMNGPVDNPISSCLSCHSTAQWPRAPIFPAKSCTDAQKLF